MTGAVNINKLDINIHTIGDVDQDAIYQLKISQAANLREVMDTLDEI